jgi:hypothetical protein
MLISVVRIKNRILKKWIKRRNKNLLKIKLKPIRKRSKIWKMKISKNQNPT